MTTSELIEALRTFDPTGDAIVLPWSATPGGDCDPIAIDPNDKSGVMLFYTPCVCLKLLKPSKGEKR